MTLYDERKNRHRLRQVCDAGMGTRGKSSRPRRDRDAHLPRRGRDVGFTRDRDETLKFRDETETKRL